MIDTAPMDCGHLQVATFVVVDRDSSSLESGEYYRKSWTDIAEDLERCMEVTAIKAAEERILAATILTTAM